VTLDSLDLIDDWGPEKIICVSDARSGMRGVLVIDNTARGTGKGGTRMSPTVSVAETARLARTMTWKWAAVDLFHGGAKAGIQGNPRGPGKERILRAFARALANEVPREYVFGLDLGMSEADAAILVDELGDRTASTGLPAVLGGLPYDELGATGFGVAEAADATASAIGIELTEATVAVQGFGAVGVAAARRIVELGGTVTAVSTSAGAVMDADGLDVDRLGALQAEVGDACVEEYGGSVDADDLLAWTSTILIPAAREDTIDEVAARGLTARLVVEGANLPTTRSGLLELRRRGITVVPDFIANAGGIIAAAHSTDARGSAFPVSSDRVFSMISDKLRANAVTVLEKARQDDVLPHDAARDLAQDRVRAAMVARGRAWTPPAGARRR
jgi:glutamate dehydrogenase (NAD(P)+)